MGPRLPHQLTQRQRVQQDRARHHESRGQHIGKSVEADARAIENDELERAGRDHHSERDRDGEIRDAEHIPEDRRFSSLGRTGRYAIAAGTANRPVSTSPVPAGNAHIAGSNPRSQ